MKKNLNNNKSTFFSKNYRLLNLIFASFLYSIAICAIIISDIKDKLLFCLISIVPCAVVFIIIDVFTSIGVRNKAKKLKAQPLEPESYNMYPINRKLQDLGLTEEQYEKLLSFRITNILTWIIVGLLLVLFTTDFSSELVLKDVILPSIIKISCAALLSIVSDLVFEYFLKKFYKSKPKKRISKKNKKPNIFIKNKRIYYVPIVIMIAIMEVFIFVDFSRVDKLYTRIIIPLEAITIINFIGMLIIDAIISYIKRIRDIVNDSGDLFLQDYDDNKFEEIERDESDEV